MGLNLFESIVLITTAVSTALTSSAIAHNLMIISKQLDHHLPKITAELAKRSLKR